MILSSCNTVKKQRQKAHFFLYQHPNELAELCATNFKDPDPIFIKGETIVKSDTLIDTVRVNVDCPDGTQVQADCPKQKTIKKTVTRTDTIYKDKTATLAKIKAYEASLLEIRHNVSLLKENALKQKSDKNNLIFIIIGLGLILAIFIYLRFKR